MPSLTLTPSTVTPQEAPDAAGTGYAKRQRLRVRQDGVLRATLRATGKGEFGPIGLQPRPVGTHTVEVDDAPTGTVIASASYTVAVAAPPPPATERSTTEINTLIAAAPVGGTVNVPAGIYRGPIVTLGKRVTLALDDNASIRGSDVFTFTGNGPWTSAQSVPTSFAQPTRWSARPHLVFVDDERQEQVTVTPAQGQFRIDSAGKVILGTNPTGKRVEVALRERQVFVTASGVRIVGGDIRHGLVPTQAGLVQVSGYGAMPVDGFVLEGTSVHWSHGACISVNGGSGLRITDADIRYGGHLGLHFSGSGSWSHGEPESGLSLQSSDWQVLRTDIGDCNFGQWDYGWECGNVKALFIDGLTFEDCEVYGQANTVYDGGRGIWTDTGVRNLTIRRVRQENTALGMFLESARDGLIEDCVLVNAAWLPADSWKGSLVLSSSGRFTVRGNVVAKSVDGIRYNGQNREEDPAHTGNVIYDNDILEMSRYGVGWGPDRNDPYISDASNRSTGNRYWRVATVTDYPAKESGSIQMTDAQAAAVYAAAGIP